MSGETPGSTGTSTDETPVYGMELYWLGLRIVFWGYLLVLVIRVAEPVLQWVGLLSQTGALETEFGQFLLIALGIAFLVAVVVGLFYAVFLYVALHGTTLVLTARLQATTEFTAFTTVGEYTASGQTSVRPELLFPSEIAGFLYLLPPALLVVAGFWQRRATGDNRNALLRVVLGYAFMAVVTILPVAWVFNEVLTPFLMDIATTSMASATIQLHVPNIIATHLIVGLIYPVVFGGIGVGVAHTVEDGP